MKKRDLPTGVIFSKQNRYLAKIYYNKKGYNLGSYLTSKEASDQYQKALADLENIKLYEKPHTTAKGGYGVDCKGGKYKARVMVKGKRVIVGVFNTSEEAVLAAAEYKANIKKNSIIVQ